MTRPAAGLDLAAHPGTAPGPSRSPRSRSITPVRPRGRRIAFVIERLAQCGGGAERVLVETANALAARGHRIEIITHEASGALPFYPVARGVILSNLRANRWPRARDFLDRARRRLERAPDLPGLDRLAWFSRNGVFWRRLGAHLRVMQPEVVVAFLPPAVTALALARVDHPMRRIASMHNAPEQDFDNPRRWEPTRLGRRRRLELMARMDRIAVLLPEYRDWYAPVLRPAVAVVPNMVQPVAPGRLASVRGSRTVISVGRLAGVKRHGLLVEAWSRLEARFPGWQLRVFGEGPLRSDLQAMIAGTRLDRVHLMGHHADMEDHYRSSAILAHPAEFEGFPLAVTEALASGLPVVGFDDCSGLNALVRDGVNGVLVPSDGDRVEAFADALAGLMADADRRAALGAAGPESVAAYAPDAVMDRWERLLFDDALSE